MATTTLVSKCKKMAKRWVSRLEEKQTSKPIDTAFGDGDGWFLPRDVYSFGALLLSIITKRVVNKYRPQNTIMSHDWAQNAYEEEKAVCQKESEYSIACGTLKQDPAYDARDGHVVTVLGMQCMEFEPERRPTMKDICKRLQSLRVVKQYKEIMLL
ncbi:protein kinase APK1B, chloroplastic-like protein [Corchorus capsularis]|uniref:Protein kinase APK1B, chloroplastic-like protein n=1 Tax=Corchorus capsularis TaxID=210143 RepID=A0A1R3K968_COCAP|nr:protein kinase APK1B, chloroplastic-like protein [Corchorus capsularis]